MKRLVWLASYPKSGNTWLRALLANLDPARTSPVGLDELGSGAASNRERFDALAGVESADLSRGEVEALRPEVYAASSRRAAGDGPLFWKMHDGFRSAVTGLPMIPVGASRGAIYLVRDPRDVVLSYAHHSGWSTHRTIRAMAAADHTLAGRPARLEAQFPQHLGSWSGHVSGWLDQDLVPVHLLRYEDLLAEPVARLADALDFVGMTVSRALVERAVEWARFDRLREREEAEGFREKPFAARAFFRKGVAEEWREALTPEEVSRVEAHHGEVMRQLGYVLTGESGA